MNALQTIKKGLSDLVAETRRRLRRGGDGETMEECFVEPQVDIYETPECVSIFVDVPGVKQSGLRLQATKDRLEIKAARHDWEAARGLSGFVPTGYRVSYQLNASLDAESVDAQLRDGVLRLRIPRSEKAKPRRIQVR